MITIPTLGQNYAISFETDDTIYVQTPTKLLDFLPGEDDSDLVSRIVKAHIMPGQPGQIVGSLNLDDPEKTILVILFAYIFSGRSPANIRCVCRFSSR